MQKSINKSTTPIIIIVCQNCFYNQMILTGETYVIVSARSEARSANEAIINEKNAKTETAT